MNRSICGGCASKLRFAAVALFLSITIGPSDVFASDTGLGLGLSMMQRIWQGKSEKQKTTTCRIARTVVIGLDKMCAYRGANGTTLAVYNDKGDYCPGSMTCRYSPFSQKTVDELTAAFRKSKKDK